MGPRLLQPGQRWEGESQSGEQAPHSRMPTLCGEPPPGSGSAQRLASVWVEGRRAHGRDSCPRGHSLLRPHVRLRDADFVHKLAKSNSIVTGELAQDLGWASTGKRGAAEPQHLHIDTGAGRKRENDPWSTLCMQDMSPRSPSPSSLFTDEGSGTRGGAESRTEQVGEGGLLRSPRP